jgi:murein DD-endopeptidase MepM/ murein hydrolase activator NlpD
MPLQNSGFEAGWGIEESHTALAITDGGVERREVGNIFTPPGWVAWYDHRGAYAQPEVRDTRVAERVKSGEKAILLFTFNRKHSAGFLQTVDARPGEKLRLSAFAHAWSNHDGEGFEHGDEADWSEGAGDDCARWLPQDIPPLNGDPQNDAMGNFAFVLGIDPTGGQDPTSSAIVWGTPAAIYNCYDSVPNVEAIAQSDRVTVYLRSDTLWAFKHNDAYWDDVALEIVEPAPEPDPPMGLPRVQYPRAYNVVPPDTSPDKAAEIFLDGWIRSKETAGGSYDDAGIGDLENKTANLHLIPADDRREYIDFYAEHYPNTRIRFIDAEGQEILWLSEPTTHVPHVVTSLYGEDRGDYIHRGLDLRSSWAHFGDELLAAIDGEIILVGVEEGKEYFGHQVQIESYVNGDRVVVRYAHLVPILDGGVYVEVGDEVRRGQAIGRPDNTGQSSGDHLHLDVRVNGSYVDPTPLIEWAEPEEPINPSPAPEEPQFPAPHQILGFQQQRARDWRDQFIDAVKPDWWKLIGGMEEAHHLLSIHPGMKIVYRHHEDDWKRYVMAADKDKAADDLIGKFADSLCNNADAIHAVEGLNEWIATNDYGTLEQASGWIEAYCAALDRIDMPAVPVTINAGVGNPQTDTICAEEGIPSQIAYLVDGVRATIAAGGYVGYHSYHGARATGPGEYYCTLDGDERRYYSMRALLEWDPHFRAKGLYPQYLFTECGTIYVAPWGGMPFADAGWKYEPCYGGDYQWKLEQAIKRELHANRLMAEWNAKHGNRARGRLVFLHGGNSDWKMFDWTGEPSVALAAALS